MNLLALSLAYIRSQALNAGLNVALLALGVATIVLLLLFGHQLEQRMARDARGIDLVIGAKGSPLQLILSSIYHLDIPTGNVPLAEVERWRAHPLVAEVVPLALGDTASGFRIVGTTDAYPALYGATLAEGRLPAAPFDATVGSEVARLLGLDVGDRFVGSHGLGGPGAEHDEHPYTVRGILEPTASVLDRLVLTTVESVWETHGIEVEEGGRGSDEDDHGAEEEPPLEVTAILVRYATPLAAVELPRLVNRETALQAAAPALEIARLLTLVGSGLDAVRLLGALLILAAALSTFIALWSGLKDRRHDMAVMRTLGAGRRTLFLQIVLEGVVLAVAGLVAGLLLGHGAAAVAPILFPKLAALGLSGWTVAPGEWLLLLLVPATGVLAALPPAIQASRSSIVDLLGARR